MEQGGLETWFEATHEDFGVDPTKYRKLTDTLDVWFDSGCSFQTVMGGPDGRATAHGLASGRHGFPADLYLEGSDQHRGWFHSSLLISSMVNGVPPYKALLTHGFAVDGDGRKMSKSKGNVVSPLKVAESLGAEILRLWVAATDYSGELTISDEILKRVVESYRRIRNTLRFLMANTADFDAATRCGSRRAIAGNRPLRTGAGVGAGHGCRGRLRALRIPSGRAAAADVLLGRPGRLLPGRAEGPPVHDGRRQHRAPLGADRAGAHSRHAAQADGADPVVHRGGGVATRPRRGSDDLRAHVADGVVQEDADAARWSRSGKRILAVRAVVQKELEAVRQSGAIGSSLQAEVAITAPTPITKRSRHWATTCAS